MQVYKANKINSKTILKRNPEQVFSNIDNEVVMLNINKGEYYCLNSISSEIWNLLKDPVSFDSIIKYLTETYDVSRDECINETLQYLNEGLDKKIIEIENADL